MVAFARQANVSPQIGGTEALRLVVLADCKLSRANGDNFPENK